MPSTWNISNKVSGLISLANIIIMGAFWFRFNNPITNISDGFFNTNDPVNSFLSSQANHYALLQIYLIGISILIAIAALWGYNAIKEGADKKAEERVNEVIPHIAREAIEKFIHSEEFENMIFKNKMTESPQKNAQEAFQEGIEMLLKDPVELPSEETV